MKFVGSLIKKINYHLVKNKNHGINALWVNIDLALITIFSLINSVLFSRIGGKELYGQYLFVLSILNFVSILSIPGTRSVVFKSASKGEDGTYPLATRFSFKWGLLQTPVLLVLGLYFYFFKDSTLGLAVMLVSALSPFLNSLIIWQSYLKGKSDFKKFLFFNFFRLILQLGGVAVLIFLSKSLVNIILWYCLSGSVLNVLYIKMLRPDRKNSKVSEQWKKQSYSLSVLNFSGLIFDKIDVFLMGLILPMGEVAIYGLTMKIVGTVGGIMTSLVEVIAPGIYKDDKIPFTYFILFSILLFLVSVLLGGIVQIPIIYFYGEEFSRVVHLSRVYLFSLPFIFFSSISSHFMIKRNLNKEINVSRIISMFVVIALYIILIPKFGALGGIIASSVYYITLSLINLVYLQELLPSKNYIINFWKRISG